MSEHDPNVVRFPGTPAQPPVVHQTLSVEEQHQLEVRLDVARERVLLWRIGVVLAGLTALLLLRQIALG